MTGTTIPVFVDKFAEGWPEHTTKAQRHRATYTPVSIALYKEYSTDAHFAAYSVPEIERRLAGADVYAEIDRGITMVAFVVDVDDAEAKKEKRPSDVYWWNDEEAKIAELLEVHPGAFVYRTKGGYRFVYLLAVPFVIRSTVDAERWKRTYVAWLDYLAAKFSIVGDRACKDWARLYRLPRVVRDGVPQAHEIWGSADAIGSWDVEVKIQEPRAPKQRSSTYTTKPGAFDIRELLATEYSDVSGHAVSGGGERFDIECPWKHEHSSDSGKRETSVFVFASGGYEFKCLHEHCANRDHEDFRKFHDPTWTPFDPMRSQSTTPPPPVDDIPPIDDEHAPSFTAAECAELEDFARDPKSQRIYMTLENIALALAKLGVCVSADEFANHELISGLDGFGPRLDDRALLELRIRIEQRFQFVIPEKKFTDVVTRSAWLARRHPVRDYLDSLQHDGVPRVGNWLATYGGAADTDYTKAVGALMLVAAVRRIRQPGAKFDEMPILEGIQGTNKSSALRMLAVHDEWFTDDLPLDGDPKHLMEQTQGRWFAEAGELKGMNKGDVAKLKATLSRQVDVARLAYGRKPTVAPRQFIIIGTTNETAGYLKDSTGNRRFWPIRIQRFDLEALKRDRDQLWAEASHLEAIGTSIRLDPKLYAVAALEQEERETEDPILILLETALGELTGKIKITDCYTIVGIAPGESTSDQQTRVGAAMRKLNWERKQRRFGDGPEWAYVKGDAAQRERQIDVVEGKATYADRNGRNGRPGRHWGIA